MNDFFKYIPKITTALSFFMLFGMNAVLFLGRKSESLRSEFLLNIFPDMYQHMSNFTLSYLLIAGIGYIWLLMAVKIKYIGCLVAAIIAVNFIYELWIPVLNTPDITDAYYGLAGSLIGFIFLIISKQYGLVENPNVGNK